MKVQRARVQRNKGAFDLVVRLVEVDVDEEDFIDDFIDVKNFSGDEDLTVRRELLPEPTPAPQETESLQPSLHGFVASPGAQLTKYQLGRRLGEGSFGVVFAAHDTVLGREVAIKLLTAKHAYDPQILSRFLQEATAAARITHPGIVTMFDCGHIDGTAFIAMELLKGETLTSRLARSGRLAPDTAMELVRQIASALDAAHRTGVIHRDLKPDNIFLVPDPAVASGERVKVLDFGLAKLRDTSSGHTQARIVFGTPCYMSPEQTRSAAKADHRSDIYGLGCILFELVCGRPPFDGELVDVVGQHQRVAPPRARSFVPSLQPKLDHLINEMLAKNPDERPQSMAAVQRTLQEIGAIAPGAAETMLPTKLAQLEGLPPETPAPRGRTRTPMRRVRAAGTPPLALRAATPMPPIIASPPPTPTRARATSRIEHTLPWGKVDLEPEIVVTSAAPVAAIARATPQPRQAPVTVLHGSTDSTPMAASVEIAVDDDPEITIDVMPRRRVGIITAIVATVIAAAILTTASLVQRHSHAAAAATLVQPTGS